MQIYFKDYENHLNSQSFLLTNTKKFKSFSFYDILFNNEYIYIKRQRGMENKYEEKDYNIHRYYFGNNRNWNGNVDIQSL